MPAKDPFERMFAQLSPEQRKRFPTVESLRAEARRRESASANDPESDELDRIFGTGAYSAEAQKDAHLSSHYDAKTGVQTFGAFRK
jgi:hypothetical protein